MKRLTNRDRRFDAKHGRFGRVVEHMATCPLVRDRGNPSQNADNDDHPTNESEGGTPVPLILEGVLEDDGTSTSESTPWRLKQWLGVFSDALPVKTVYQLSDIALLCRDAQHQRPPFVHINCLGDIDRYSRPYIVLLKERLYLDDQETIDAFRNFRGLPIFFSSCNLGPRTELIQTFRHAAELGPVAAPIGSILESEARLYGLMLYQSILAVGMDFDIAVNNCYQAGRIVGITGQKGKAHVRLYV